MKFSVKKGSFSIFDVVSIYLSYPTLVFKIDIIPNHSEKKKLYINYFSLERVNFIILLKSLIQKNKVAYDKICFKMLVASLIRY